MSDLEIRFTKSVFAIVCVFLMVAMSFQGVSANPANDVDNIIDHYGIHHKVWKEDVNGTYQVFYANNIGYNNTGIGQGGLQITQSLENVQYPQIAIDPVSDYGYVIWISNSEIVSV